MLASTLAWIKSRIFEDSCYARHEKNSHGLPLEISRTLAILSDNGTVTFRDNSTAEVRDLYCAFDNTRLGAGSRGYLGGCILSISICFYHQSPCPFALTATTLQTRAPNDMTQWAKIATSSATAGHTINTTFGTHIVVKRNLDNSALGPPKLYC